MLSRGEQEEEAAVVRRGIRPEKPMNSMKTFRGFPEFELS
jgi:hypothetical protein